MKKNVWVIAIALLIGGIGLVDLIFGTTQTTTNGVTSSANPLPAFISDNLTTTTDAVLIGLAAALYWFL